MDTRKYREKLVEHLRKEDYLHREDVEKAFLSIPRENFIWSIWKKVNGEWKSFPVSKNNLSDELAKEIYIDWSIPILVEGDEIVSSSSQPAVMSVMIEEADIREGDKVLEIGTGSGYNAAILNQIVGKSGKVVTIEINDTVYNLAKAAFKNTGLSDDIILLKRNAVEGAPEHAPFDSIIVTTSTPEIPHTWFDELKAGGRLIMPYVVRGSEILLKLIKLNDYILSGEGIHYVVFSRLKGVSATKHFPLFKNEFISLKEIIDEYGVEDSSLTKAFSNLSQRDRQDFAFFLSTHCENSFSMLTEDEKKVYGIIKEEGSGMGVVAVLDKKVIKWGAHAAYFEFKNILDKWKELGKPGLKDYKILFTKKKKVSAFVETDINFINFI